MTDTEKQTAEAMLRAIFLRPDLTPEGREEFIQEMMAGKTELTITWDDLCILAKVAAAPVAAQGERHKIPCSIDAKNVCTTPGYCQKNECGWKTY